MSSRIALADFLSQHANEQALSTVIEAPVWRGSRAERHLLHYLRLDSPKENVQTSGLTKLEDSDKRSPSTLTPGNLKPRRHGKREKTSAVALLQDHYRAQPTPNESPSGRLAELKRRLPDSDDDVEHINTIYQRSPTIFEADSGDKQEEARPYVLDNLNASSSEAQQIASQQSPGPIALPVLIDNRVAEFPDYYSQPQSEPLQLAEDSAVYAANLAPAAAQSLQDLQDPKDPFLVPEQVLHLGSAEELQSEEPDWDDFQDGTNSARSNESYRSLPDLSYLLSSTL